MTEYITIDIRRYENTTLIASFEQCYLDIREGCILVLDRTGIIIFIGDPKQVYAVTNS